MRHHDRPLRALEEFLGRRSARRRELAGALLAFAVAFAVGFALAFAIGIAAARGLGGSADRRPADQLPRDQPLRSHFPGEAAARDASQRLPVGEVANAP